MLMCVGVRECVRVCILCVYMYTYICVCVRVYIHMYVHVCVCMCVCVCACVCVFMYIYLDIYNMKIPSRDITGIVTAHTYRRSPGSRITGIQDGNMIRLCTMTPKIEPGTVMAHSTSQGTRKRKIGPDNLLSKRSMAPPSGKMPEGENKAKQEASHVSHAIQLQTACHTCMCQKTRKLLPIPSLTCWLVQCCLLLSSGCNHF